MARIFEVAVREKYRQAGQTHRLALKVAKEECEAALVAESDFLRRFDHPNVVRILPLPLPGRPSYAAREQFRFGWGWYYPMELLKGGSLESRLTRPTGATDLLRPPSERERRLSLLETVGIGSQLAAALEHIHEHNVINLDVKPGNVLFRKRRMEFLRGSVPKAVLCDFGISRDLRYPRAGVLGVATPEYVSPEQILETSHHRQQADTRSDIFSLGVVLYEMLTGVLPFNGNVALRADPTYDPTPPRRLRPSVPRPMEEVIMRALAKSPAHRFRTAAEMGAALDQVPRPADWGAMARRTIAGVTAAACIAAGSYGFSRWSTGGDNDKGLSTSAPAVKTSTVTPTATRGTHTPTTQPTVSPTTRRPTSTPAPTSTATNTPLPPTRTPTPTPGG
jgi:serine/threonine protein kinase